MVQCNRCNLQYIGETKRRLKDRFNEHRRAVDKTNIKSKPTTVSKHFLSHSNPRGGGHLGILWVGMCRPGRDSKLAPRSKKNFP